MKELIPQLRQAAKAYYQESREIMSNFEYDKLYDELSALEAKTGIILSGSPTQQVGYQVLSELPKETHEEPMLSLDKTKSVEDLQQWLGSQKGLLSWKMDGLTVVLTYENGTLAKAVTRGNGEIGEVITPNARAFSNIPLSIAYKGKKMVGFANWAKLIKDTKFWIAFKNNVIIMILSIVIQIPLGLAMATFLDFGGKKLTVFKVIWFIPMLMSSVAIGFLFTYALATNGGIVSTISGWFGGGNIDLLGNPKLALITVILIIAWQFTPFYMVYFMAGYTNIPYDVFEAARIDGATRGQYFWKIALPLLVPSIKSAAILSMVGSLKYFDLIYVMTGGGPGTSTELMATYMYKESFKNFNMGYGSAIAGGMFILITMVSMITMKLVNGKQED